MGEPVKVSDENFEEEVLNADIPVLVDCWAEWCGPCKMIAPIMEDIAEEYGDQIKICKLNVDENEEVPSRFGIMSIPTLLYFEDGEQTDKIVGYQPKEKILEELEIESD